jgi:hypothetical protein
MLNSLYRKSSTYLSWRPYNSAMQKLNTPEHEKVNPLEEKIQINENMEKYTIIFF